MPWGRRIEEFTDFLFSAKPPREPRRFLKYSAVAVILGTVFPVAAFYLFEYQKYVKENYKYVGVGLANPNEFIWSLSGFVLCLLSGTLLVAPVTGLRWSGILILFLCISGFVALINLQPVYFSKAQGMPVIFVLGGMFFRAVLICGFGIEQWVQHRRNQK